MLTKQLDNTINAFDPIHLDEMNGTALMNRVDTKFVITLAQLSKSLKILKEFRQLSGLKTNISKTKYALFGNAVDYQNIERNQKLQLK